MNKRLILYAMGICCSFFASAQVLSDNYKKLQQKLASGWNTWDYSSMMSHVLLPQGLMMKLNLRQSFIGTPNDHDFLLNELVVDRSGLVKPIAHSFDGSYTELLIENWKGNSIRVQSAAKGNDVVVLVTPLVRSKDIHYAIEMEVGFLWNRKGTVVKKGSSILATVGQDKYIFTSTHPPITIYQPYLAPYLTVKGDSACGFYTGKKKTTHDIRLAIDKAKSDFENYSRKYETLDTAFQAIQTVLGWNTIYDPEQNRVITPVSRGWNKAWQGYVLFAWDTYFSSILFGLDNKDMAYSNAIAVTKGINKLGHIGHWQMPGYQTAVGMSQPPVGALVCWKLYDKFHDKWFLKEVYNELLTWNRWWAKDRTNKGFLCWGGWKDAELQIAKWESGLDNSPMYEGVTMHSEEDHSVMNLADVGLNSLYAADCDYLSRIAKELGKIMDEQELTARNMQFRQATNRLWDSSAGIYLNKHLDSISFSTRLSPTLFYPMIAGIASPAQADTMIRKHFYNEKEFYGDFILPSVSRNDTSYDNQYWRGCIWPPMNFLVYTGLTGYNKKAASDLAGKSIKLFMQGWSQHCVFENINADKGAFRREDQLNTDPFYHWGALMAIMAFMESGKY